MTFVTFRRAHKNTPNQVFMLDEALIGGNFLFGSYGRGTTHRYIPSSSLIFRLKSETTSAGPVMRTPSPRAKIQPKK